MSTWAGRDGDQTGTGRVELTGLVPEGTGHGIVVAVAAVRDDPAVGPRDRRPRRWGRGDKRRDIRPVAGDRLGIGVNNAQVRTVQIEGDRTGRVVTARERRRVVKVGKGESERVTSDGSGVVLISTLAAATTTGSSPLARNAVVVGVAAVGWRPTDRCR